ncbi:MAG: class I SAM-dependent methyltransferase [Propionibacteriaceae bacterium]|nr:class I SAM-dependent methyltransferase [Propionibacteriaceae bacterium]
MSRSNQPRAGQAIASAYASWSYAEEFFPQPEVSLQARANSHRLGLTPVSPGVAQTLTLLARLIQAKAVVEIGTGAGVASLALLAGMDPGGVLTSLDSEADHHQIARAAAAQAGFPPRRHRFITGRALEVLRQLMDQAYDLVLIDAEPLEYPEYVEEALRLLRPGGLLAIHHALLDGAVAEETNLDDEPLIVRETLEAVRELEQLTSALLPVGDGLMVSIKR